MTATTGHIPFVPPWWLSSPHGQTLWPAVMRRCALPPVRSEMLELPDGDFVDLCWCGPQEAGAIVMLLHGLEGSAHSPYIRGMLHAAVRQGWRAVLMHFRGCGGRQNRLDRSYHSGDTGDIEFLARTLRQRHPAARIGAVGYSLGGNALLKYLGETGSQSHLDAAVAVSVPYQLADGAQRLGGGFSRLYQWHLLRSLRRKVGAKFQGREQAVLHLDAAKIAKLDSFWKFDDAVTARLHGFRDVHDYYDRCSSRQFLRAITVPTLLIHASDDPFMLPTTVPTKSELAPSTELEVYECGGHVGFVTGSPWRPRYWLEQRIPAFLRSHIE